MSDEKKPNHDYEPGDKIRCLSPEWPGKYSHYLEVGAIYTIEMITDEGNIFVEEQIGRYYPRQFELCGCSEKENDMSDEKKSDHDYEPGDRVRCVRPTTNEKMEEGGVYTVTTVKSNAYGESEIALREIGSGVFYSVDRFEALKAISNHNYNPEKIRDAIQDHLYCSERPLGDLRPPKSAEEIEDGVCVFDVYEDFCRIFFRVMDSWFNFVVPRAEIENDPTIAERFVGGERKKYTGEVEIFPNHSNAVICFEDGSKARFYGDHWRVL